MFIINISDIPKRFLYICNKEQSDKLIKDGFCLLGIERDKYCYYKSKKFPFNRFKIITSYISTIIISSWFHFISSLLIICIIVYKILKEEYHWYSSNF